MSEVEVGFGSVLGDVDLAVLIGAHGAWVDVDVGIELLSGDLETSRLEESAERRGGYSLAETRDDASGHKDIFCHTSAFLKKII